MPPMNRTSLVPERVAANRIFPACTMRASSMMTGVQMVATTLHVKNVFLALTLCVAMLCVAIPSREVLILGLFQKPTSQPL